MELKSGPSKDVVSGRLEFRGRNVSILRVSSPGFSLCGSRDESLDCNSRLHPLLIKDKQREDSLCIAKKIHKIPPTSAC